MTPEEILDINIDKHGKHIPHSEKNDFYKKYDTSQRSIIIESMKQYAAKEVANNISVLGQEAKKLNEELQSNLNTAIYYALCYRSGSITDPQEDLKAMEFLTTLNS